MPGPLANALYILAAIAIVIAHSAIIRSSLKSLATQGATASPRTRVREFVWAVLPALALVALLIWTWRTMHPGTMTFQLPADRGPLGGIRT